MRNRMLTGMAIAGAMSQTMDLSSAIAKMDPAEPGNGQTHGNGSRPVPGGGSKERARRLAQLEKGQT